MSTTIHLSDDLMERIASAAERTGKTTHGFILEAIEEKVGLAELRNDFDAEADARFANLLATGTTLPWADTRQYLEDRLAGKQVPRPVAKKTRT